MKTNKIPTFMKGLIAAATPALITTTGAQAAHTQEALSGSDSQVLSSQLTDSFKRYSDDKGKQSGSGGKKNAALGVRG